MGGRCTELHQQNPFKLDKWSDFTKRSDQLTAKRAGDNDQTQAQTKAADHPVGSGQATIINNSSRLVNPDDDHAEGMTSAKLKSMLAKKAKVAAAAKNLAKGRAVDKTKPGVGSGLLHSGGDDEEAGSEDDDEAGAIGTLDDLGAVLRGAKVLRSLKSIKTTLAKLPDDDQNRSERKDLLIKQASVLGATALQLSKIPAMPWPEILKNADSLDNAGFESSKFPL